MYVYAHYTMIPAKITCIFVTLIFSIVLNLFYLLNYWSLVSEVAKAKLHLEREINGPTDEKKKEPHIPSLSPSIVFVTPTCYRPAQKADLTRLGQTLAAVPRLFWIIVEDSSASSPFIDNLLKRIGVEGVHLVQQTPQNKKALFSDPNHKFPRGIEQRNAALRWIRENLVHLNAGVVYFGDDDNTYDWRIFFEMTTIRMVGIWPVGIVGGMLVERPLIDEHSKVVGFNAKWKPKRPFPIDMAGFAMNISLIHANPNTLFSYRSARGFLESHFLQLLGLNWSDLEPKAENCTKVYVWHTRTEKILLDSMEKKKFLTKTGLDAVELDALL